ncbi:MAG: type II toxin-antitoxin system Phd/YefM family antitoxin [Planctomycetes bacterium]|nr:type II toxin-antitoxin system Phd/YefM family antitoxin [Planctomycetota bacterium]
MKTVTVSELQNQVRRCLRIAQKECIVLTRHGRPAAVVIGVEGRAWEDVLYRTSPSFWRMIAERRKGKTVSSAEMRRRLEARWTRRKKR